MQFYATFLFKIQGRIINSAHCGKYFQHISLLIGQKEFKFCFLNCSYEYT